MLNKNFYDSVEEATNRLRGTVVLYENEPYSVTTIRNHKDGIYRVYLEPFNENSGRGRAAWLQAARRDAAFLEAEAMGGTYYWDALDKLIDDGKVPVIRKQINSPKFNNFRPFPLGMCNSNGHCYYLERRPTRRVPQGMTLDSVLQTRISLSGDEQAQPLSGVQWGGTPFIETIKGMYLTPRECLDGIRNPANANTAVGFSRDFAFVRGPIGLIFLAYRTDTVGLVGTDNSVTLAKNFRHLKEVTEALRFFTAVQIEK